MDESLDNQRSEDLSAEIVDANSNKVEAESSLTDAVPISPETSEKIVDEVNPNLPAEEAVAPSFDVAASSDDLASTVEEAPVDQPKEPLPVDEGERRWFVIQTFSGQEDKVKANIEREVAQMNMAHKIFRILVPEEETLEIKGSKRIEKVRKMFPGYVFIEMVLDDEAWYTIRQTPGVSRFIGSGTKPQPVLDREMQRVLKQIGVKEEKLEAAFDLGETVRIISGPFRGYTGSVNEVNVDKGKLKILISIFGRDTPVEVNFEHAEKIS